MSSESVAQAMEMLGIRSLPRVIRRAAGTSPPLRQPAAFESAPESFEQVPRLPAAARSGSAPAALGRRVLAYEAPAVRGSTTAAGVAMPVVGIVDELLVGGDMARIRRILSHSLAPNAEERDFMRSYGLDWNDETLSYHIMSIGWRLYWIGKWILNPMVLNPEADPEIQNLA
ncbi:MAG: hypothetical protein M3461_13160 [Pseudomonadota bacterium]|nr:hypothetical protein [Pseudomonadota bacterium]